MGNEQQLRFLRQLYRRGGSLLTLLLIIFGFTGCRPHLAPEPTDDITKLDTFKTEQTSASSVDFASASELESLSSQGINEYIIGPGDILSLDVWHHPELSMPELLVGPDGQATVPRVGAVHVDGLTRAEASAAIQRRLAELYSNSDMTLTVRSYKNNRAYVLGRVRAPGIVHFPGKGSLVEAISLAGGIPEVSNGGSPYPTKCALIRGKDQIYWIDLDDLLRNGNMALNASIQPNDVIFIPEAKQALVYVMGEVGRPGAMVLRREMTYWDALMLAGGPTQDANLQKTFLVRWDGDKSHVREIDLRKAIAEGNLSENYVLQDNDVIYVAQQGNRALELLHPANYAYAPRDHTVIQYVGQHGRSGQLEV